MKLKKLSQNTKAYSGDTKKGLESQAYFLSNLLLIFF